MNLGLDMIATNLSMSIEHIILLLCNIGFIIFFAKDFRLGAVLGFVGNAALFLLFYALQWIYDGALIALFMYLIIMTGSLFFLGGVTSQEGGFL